MARHSGPLYVGVVSIERCYGGPEEGGWWYDAGTVLGYYKVRRSEMGHRPPGQHCLPWDRIKPEVVQRIERMAAKDFGYLPVKPKGYRGRGSVIGGPDIELVCSMHVPQDYPAERPHYE